MLKVENAQIKYGNFVAVENLTFEVAPGEIFGLLGANGSGKTTTFRVIMGLLTPSQGSVTYNDQVVSYETVNKIGYMIEERSLMTKLTVKNMMIYFGSLKGVSRTDILNRLDYWLHRFGVPEYRDKKIKELSKGNQQKIQFISALINEPTMLILDEPFSGLDVINMELFIEVIREQQAKGTLIIFSSHRIDQVEKFCQKVVILKKGVSVVEGIVKDIKKDYKKQNIHVIADYDISKVKAIAGVIDVKINELESIIKIESDDISERVFDYIKTCKNVKKFEVEAATLTEIFIERAGITHEEV